MVKYSTLLFWVLLFMFNVLFNFIYNGIAVKHLNKKIIELEEENNKLRNRITDYIWFEGKLKDEENAGQ